jgi:MoaA/NifB/PqqE/SkfB family radical SAM enzyme
VNPFLFPSTVIFEPVNKCNLGCEFCEANCTVNQHIPRREISPDEMRMVLTRLRGVIANIVFQGDCEPTLHRNLPELVRIAAEHSSSVVLVTNGTRLRKDYTRQLVESGVNWFALSIDDHRREVFNRLRVRADLAAILENLRDLLSLRDAEHAQVHVVVHKIVFPHDTLESLKEFVPPSGATMWRWQLIRKAESNR